MINLKLREYTKRYKNRRNDFYAFTINLELRKYVEKNKMSRAE